MKRFFSVVLLGISLNANSQSDCLTAYTDSFYLQAIYFSFNGISHSHWLQPWRGYLETVPATTYLNGVGVNMHGITEKPELYAEMLARHGIRHGRIEIPWAVIDYDTGSIKSSTAFTFTSLLQACKKWGIRPLILLNAHHGVPNPEYYYPPPKTLAAPAVQGTYQIVLNDVDGITVGKTGVCNLTDYWACEAIITGLNGNTANLSKPWPITMPAGTGLTMFTLKYLPFSTVGSTEFNETMTGWLAYADTVATFVANALGTSNSEDKGFDLEVWNELAFGSNYLNINNYYNPPYDQSLNIDQIRAQLVYQTAGYAQTNAGKFSGVRINDGIANTLPWPASSTSHPRLDAIGKHPYSGMRNYPANNPGGSTALNAFGEPASFNPVYSGVIPEYFLLGLQVEHIVRDMAPINTKIYNTVHGRNARIVDGKVSPVPLFITEIGISPKEFGVTDTARALALKAKVVTRLYSVYLNKGAEVVDIFAANIGNLEFGMIKDNFSEYVKTGNTYPEQDSIYTSPTLFALKNIVEVMKDDLDTDLSITRVVTLDSICDSHDHYQFLGNGTAGHPHLFNRDVFAFLPYQVNDRRLVIHYYVMTRDVMKDFTPEQFTISIGGVNGNKALVKAYDPILNKDVPLTVLARSDQALKLDLTATDYPYLLTIDEGSLTGIPEPLVGQRQVEFEVYPNPSIGLITINYSVAAYSHVKLTVLDRLGREVGEAVDCYQSPGNYLVHFSGSELPAGLYLCKLEAGDAVRCRLLVVEQ